MPDARAGRGRGLAVVAALADDITVSENSEFVEVQARFTLPDDDP